MARTKQVAKTTNQTIPAGGIKKPEHTPFITLRLTNTLQGKQLKVNAVSQPNYVEDGKQLTLDEIIEKERERKRISTAVQRQKKKQASIDAEYQQRNRPLSPASSLGSQQPIRNLPTTIIPSSKEVLQHMTAVGSTPYAHCCHVLLFAKKVPMAVPAEVLPFDPAHAQPPLLPHFKDQFKNILTSLEQEKGLGMVKRSLR